MYVIGTMGCDHSHDDWPNSVIFLIHLNSLDKKKTSRKFRGEEGWRINIIASYFTRKQTSSQTWTQALEDFSCMIAHPTSHLSFARSKPLCVRDSNSKGLVRHLLAERVAKPHPCQCLIFIYTFIIHLLALIRVWSIQWFALSAVQRP